MSTQIIFGIAVGVCLTGISSACAYLLWIHAREILVRERLFIIRERLWMKAYELDALKDPAYLDARNTINGAIAICHYFCLPALAVIPDRGDRSVRQRPTSSNPDVQAAIDQMRSEMVAEVIFHVRRRHFFSGTVMPFLVRLVTHRRRAEQANFVKVLQIATNKNFAAIARYCPS